MKLFKLAIISVVVLFVILTLLGLLLPSTVRVTRNINIHAPFNTLYHYTGDMKNWPLWMENFDAKTMHFTTSQTQGKGAVTAIGKFQIYIVKDTNDTIESVWQSNNRTHQLCVFQLQNDTAANTINFNWYFEQKLKWYPWERLPAIANDKVFGPFMEHSLDKLKTLAENNEN
ncbi:MAG: hypothetical protein M3R72_08545 [Bacteroidota bacterium]|nr:hypothetical protein [Bacteroidota bacterium]